MLGVKKNMEFPSNRMLQPFVKANCSAPARNLRKSDLGAVIFGCKNHTIKECYFKELFGLPASHFAYVKKITPGLVLFLFNYSNRTLHGIFEATGPGKLNINPHGWTVDGTESSPYPAQVKVRIKKRCCTLTEDQFKPIISMNYYEGSHFYFELDRSQTSNLLSLFTSLPFDADACTSKNITKWNTFFNPLPALDIRHERESCLSSDKGFVSNASTSIPQRTWTSLFKSSSECKGIHIEKDVSPGTSVPQKTWSSLLKNSSDCDGSEKDEIFWTEALNSCHPVDKSSMDFESSCMPCSKRVSSESEGNMLDSSQRSEEVDNWEPIWDRQGVALDARQCFDESGNWESDRDNYSALTEVISFTDNTLAAEAGPEDKCLKLISSDLNAQHLEEANMVAGLRLLNIDGDGSQPSDSDCSAVNEMISEENHEKDASHFSFSTGVQIEIACSPKTDINAATSSSDIQSVVVKLMQEIDGLKGHQLKQIMTLNRLEKELVDSKAQIAQLKNRCSMLECGELSSAVRVREEYKWLDKSISDMDETILIVGGFDGSSWLADLNSYCPLRDMMTSLCPMTTRRSYSSAARLGDEIFVFGGMDGDIWYDTVESYNLRSGLWVSRPSLNKKKGSLAGVYLSNKIFAIGGGNGVDCFAEVEMYDPNIGRWILTRSMQYKRFAPAASAMNNALYVTGGYDGREYLSTVERFDPREHSWIKVGNMITKRSCHSVAVLNEKLYALGGCDGGGIHSTVEIFDPRMNSWIFGESMSNSRAYAGAVVLGGKIYVIGGMKEKNGISDTIECYTEEYGWEVTNLKAFGKRCFFSAVAY